jgi:excisionase family DNA binding protein
VDKLTVEEAAKVLGIKEESVRKRVSRGTLDAQKDPDGRLMVWVDMSVTGTGTVRDEYGDLSVASGADADFNVVAAKDETISILTDQLREEREARRRADTLLAQLTQATSNLTERLRELEAPAESPQEPQEASETVGEGPERAEPRSAEGAAQDELGAERARRETAESTLHEGMAEERRRREEAERERDELRRELVGRGRRTEAHEAAERQQGRGQPQSATGGAQEGAQPRSWWRTRIGSIIGGCLVLGFVALVGFVLTTLILR